MSSDCEDYAPPKFSGRTYSRLRQSQFKPLQRSNCKQSRVFLQKSETNFNQSCVSSNQKKSKIVDVSFHTNSCIVQENSKLLHPGIKQITDFQQRGCENSLELTNYFVGRGDIGNKNLRDETMSKLIKLRSSAPRIHSVKTHQLAETLKGAEGKKKLNITGGIIKSSEGGSNNIRAAKDVVSPLILRKGHLADSESFHSLKTTAAQLPIVQDSENQTVKHSWKIDTPRKYFSNFPHQEISAELSLTKGQQEDSKQGQSNQIFQCLDKSDTEEGYQWTLKRKSSRCRSKSHASCTISQMPTSSSLDSLKKNSNTHFPLKLLKSESQTDQYNFKGRNGPIQGHSKYESSVDLSSGTVLGDRLAFLGRSHSRRILINDDLPDEPMGSQSSSLSSGSADLSVISESKYKYEALQDVIFNDCQNSMAYQDAVDFEGKELPLLPKSLSSSQPCSEANSQDSISPCHQPKFFKSKKSFVICMDVQPGTPNSKLSQTPGRAAYNAMSWYSDLDLDSELQNDLSYKEKGDSFLLLNRHDEPKLQREVHWSERQRGETFTSLCVSSAHKKLYTVVQNVKETHEVQEMGETQDFMDEVDYLLDNLQNTNSAAVRCLSCLQLASKCASSSFRMHMRAHETASRICALLDDAWTDPSLALCAAAFMFMLSRDRLAIDMDSHTLQLVVRLCQSEMVHPGIVSPVMVPNTHDLNQMKQKVKELLAQVPKQQLDISDLFVSAESLALECLVNMASRCPGQSFKDELRSVGGLDHMVDSVNFCQRYIEGEDFQDTKKMLPILRRLHNSLKVLENVSFMNSDNQKYLTQYCNSLLLESCCRIIQELETQLQSQPWLKGQANPDVPVQELILTCLMDALRLLLNITYGNKPEKLDNQHEVSLIQVAVHCLFVTVWYMPTEQRFDFTVMCLGLLINLVQDRPSHSCLLVRMSSTMKPSQHSQPVTVNVVQATADMFVQMEQAAKNLEEESEVDVVSPAASGGLQSGQAGVWGDAGTDWVDNRIKTAEKLSACPAAERLSSNGSHLKDAEAYTTALNKAREHMENSIVASYAGLLLGSIIKEHQDYSTVIRNCLPNGDFGPMVKVLKKFLNFMNLTTAGSIADIEGIDRVIQVLESFVL